MIRNLVPQFKKARLFCIFLLLPTLLFSQQKIALVLGVNEYDLLSPLKAAVNDSEKIASYYGGLGFKVVLQNDRQENRMDRPSLPNFQRALSNIADSASDEGISELVFFFAGHGVQIAGENFLCFPETQLQDRSGMLSVDSVLVPWLRDNKAKLTMVYLDACRNDLGPVRAAGVTRGLEVVSTGPALSEDGRSMAVFYASKAGEFSYEKPDGSNGFFTDVLLEGLQADSTSTIIDLFNYLKRALPSQTEAAYGKPQIPRLGGDMETEAVFTKGKVDLSAFDTGGRLYVETDRPGAVVLVNGIRRGESPLLIEGLSPGQALVEARLPGFYASSQVSIVRKALVRTNLGLSELTGNLVLNSLRFLSSDKSGPGESLPPGIASGMEMLLDEKPFAKLSGLFVQKIQLGTHAAILRGNGYYWEGSFRIEGNDTVKLDPVFEAVGTLEFSLPETATLRFKSAEGRRDLVIEGSADTVPDFPAGRFTVSVSSPSYKPGLFDLVVPHGGRASFAPQLEYTDLAKKGLEIKDIELRIGKNIAQLPRQKASRLTLDTLGWIGTGTGAALGVAAGVLYYLARDSYDKYLSEPKSSSAAALHEQVLTYTNLSLGLGAGGLGLLGLSILPLSLGPRPGVLEEANNQLDAELEKARKEYQSLQRAKG